MPVFFLNLSAAEFLVILGAVSSLITALYLLDKRKRIRVVGTLRFWTDAHQSDSAKSRRQLQQPWSLLLQLLSLLLLLLAIAQVQWGFRPQQPRTHVLLIDTSSWSTARLTQSSTVLAAELSLARKYIALLPPNDRVLLASANSVTTLAGQISSDRNSLIQRLSQMRPSSSGLQLRTAIAFALGALRMSAGLAGEIVYVGPGIVSDGPENLQQSAMPGNLRILTVPVSTQNAGFTSLAVSQDQGHSGERRAHLRMANSGPRPQRLLLRAAAGNLRFPSRIVTVPAASETAVDYSFRTLGDATFNARLTREDGGDPDMLQLDDVVSMPIPAVREYQISAYTTRPDRLRPLLEANPAFAVRFRAPAEYAAEGKSDAEVLDGFVPAANVPRPTLYLNPPLSNPLVKVKGHSTNATVKRWDAGLLGDSGLHTQELNLADAELFAPADGITSVAETEEGSVAVAAESQGRRSRWFAVGTDIAGDQMRMDLTTPLLVANAMRWLVPDAFRPSEYAALPVGTVQVPLEAGETEDDIHISGPDGASLPFSVKRSAAELFVTQPQTFTFDSPTRHLQFAAAIAAVPGNVWIAPAAAARGLPPRAAASGKNSDLWRLLALAGGSGLCAEWLLFGGFRKRSTVRLTKVPQRISTKERMPA